MEHKVTSPSHAAVLADEYVLFNETNSIALGSDRVVLEGRAVGGSCNYCKCIGHRKGECPVLKSKTKFSSAHVKPAALTSSNSSGELDVQQPYPRKTMEDF